MAEIQTITAAVSLAKLAIQTAGLVQQVYRAGKDADDLYCKVKHLHTVSKLVSRVLKNRQQSCPPTSWSEDERDVQTSIFESLEECNSCLIMLDQCLLPLQTKASGEGHLRIASRFNYVFDKPFISRQTELIKTQIDILKVNLDLVNLLDNGRILEAVRPIRQLNQEVANQALQQGNKIMADFVPKETQDAINHERERSRPSSVSAIDSDSENQDPHFSIENGCPECKQRGSPVPDTSLAIAVKYKQPASVKYWIDRGEDVKVEDKDKWTLLHHATHRVDPESVKYLLRTPEASGLLDAQTTDGQTALMHVASYVETEGSYEIAEAFIQSHCSIDLNDYSEDHRTALYFAVNGSKTDNRQNFIRLLVDNGATVSPVWDQLKGQCKAYEVLQRRKDVEARQKKEQEQRRPSGGVSPPNRKSSFVGSMSRKLSKVFTNDSAIAD